MKCAVTANILRIDFDEGTFSVSRGEHKRIDEVGVILIPLDAARDLAKALADNLPSDELESIRCVHSDGTRCQSMIGTNELCDGYKADCSRYR